MEQPTEKVARIGFEGLKQLLEHGAKHFRPKDWQLLSAKMKALFAASTPHRLNCGHVRCAGSFDQN